MLTERGLDQGGVDKADGVAAEERLDEDVDEEPVDRVLMELDTLTGRWVWPCFP